MKKLQSETKPKTGTSIHVHSLLCSLYADACASFASSKPELPNLTAFGSMAQDWFFLWQHLCPSGSLCKCCLFSRPSHSSLHSHSSQYDLACAYCTLLLISNLCVNIWNHSVFVTLIQISAGPGHMEVQYALDEQVSICRG